MVDTQDRQMNMKKHFLKWARASRNALNDHVLAPCDVMGTSKPSSDHAPVFIIGAPRSGSTLLAQLVTQCLEVGYFSNFHAQLYGSPALAEKLRTLSSSSYQSDFTSKHGATKGWHAPSENAAFWYRFFRRRPAFVPLSEMPEISGRAFQRSLTRFIQVADSSLLIKNLYAVLRLEVIQHYLPEAKFIVLHRNLRDNAVSILNSRLKLYGTYHHWWSVEPPEITDLKRQEPVSQVLGQIDAIYTLIEAAKGRAQAHSTTFLDVQYEQLCAKPTETLSRICDFIPGCNLRLTSIQNLPSQFEPTQRDLSDRELCTELSRQLDSR